MTEKWGLLIRGMHYSEHYVKKTFLASTKNIFENFSHKARSKKVVSVTYDGAD